MRNSGEKEHVYLQSLTKLLHYAFKRVGPDDSLPTASMGKWNVFDWAKRVAIISAAEAIFILYSGVLLTQIQWDLLNCSCHKEYSVCKR